MKLDTLESVVLTRNIPEHGLQMGDLGTVVQVYPGGAIEVEFVTCSGATQALLTLGEEDVREVDSQDLPATRRLK